MPSEAQVTKSAIDRLKSAIQAKRKADKALVSFLLFAHVLGQDIESEAKSGLNVYHSRLA